MKQVLVAYLIRDNERVWDMPTDELLVALDQLMQANITQEQSMSSNKAAVYEFLQTVKLAMRTPEDVCQVKPL
jgi:hypothetical protein